MKQFNNTILISLLFFSNLYAYDLSAWEDTNLTTSNIHCQPLDTRPIKKTHESTYDKFERIFSEYEGSWFEDMFIYSADIIMPDEMAQAIKDVVKNREDKGFEDQVEKLPKKTREELNKG